MACDGKWVWYHCLWLLSCFSQYFCYLFIRKHWTFILIYSLILSLYFLSILSRTVAVMFITFHLSLCFTGDSVMVSTEMAILRLLDPIQEFIFRRLCGELQEVFSKSSRPVSVQLHRCPWWPTLTSARMLSVFFNRCLISSEQSSIFMSWGSWLSCVALCHNTTTRFLTVVSLNWLSTGSQSCENQTSRYQLKL